MGEYIFKIMSRKEYYEKSRITIYDPKLTENMFVTVNNQKIWCETNQVIKCYSDNTCYPMHKCHLENMEEIIND